MSDDMDRLDPYVEWIATEARRPVSIDPAARQRLLDAIRAEPAPQRSGRVLAWLVEPRRFVLPPIAAAALAAGLVGIGILGGSTINRDGRQSTERPPADVASPRLPDSARAVKFVLIAPQAARVAVVGDFNGWDAAATPAVREKDGTWSTYIPLRPGRYVYSFVVDGTHFVSDPAAPIAPDDGYGQKNSVVVVAGAVS
jgi:hypothetical protein